MKPSRSTQRVLTAGFAIIAALLVVQDVAIYYLHHIRQARSQQMERNSLVSIEQLGRVAQEVERERILLGNHVLAETPAQMAPIERELAATTSDLHQAEETYRGVIDSPAEAGLWASAQSLIHFFENDCGRIIAVSRENRDVEARSMMAALQPLYAELERVLAHLVQVNRDDALESMASLRAAAAFTERAAGAVTVFTFAFIAVMVRWLYRSVLWYEHQLRESAAELDLRNRDLDAFAARVAHDLRNALAPLGFMAALLRRQASDPERVLATTARLQEGVKKAAGLVDALLAFSRGSHEVAPNEHGAVLPVLEGVLEEVRPLAARLEVTLSTERLQEAEVRCSPDLLHIVIANLVGNAVKYLEAREERTVRIAGETDGDLYRLTITDTGPGIPARDLERIFEPFYRVQGSVAPGTGIGLATVRRILDAHHGRIQVESRVGEGTSFQVWLPLAAELRREHHPGPEGPMHPPSP